MTDIIIGGIFSIICLIISFILYKTDDDFLSTFGFSLGIAGVFITIIELIKILL